MKDRVRSNSPSFSRRAAIGSAAGGLAIPGSVSQASTGGSRDHNRMLWQESESGFAQAVTTTHHQATQAGADILRAGGSAADAAVSIAAVLSVVEPYFSHILGGGAWALYYDAESGNVTAMDGVGPTGSKFNLQDYAARVEGWGIHQSNVPGAWDGYMLWLRDHGRLPLPEILAPAIALAEEGIAVSEEMAAYMGRSYDAMAAHPPTAAVYMAAGWFPGAGEIIRYPDLAATFRSIGEAYTSAGDHAAGIQAARDYYYRGPLAEALSLIHI